MPDINKVVDWLRKCDGEVRCKYPNCPYNISKRCVSLLHDDTITLPKAQEPVEPKYVSTGDWARQHLECGACGTIIKRSDKHCRACGRKVKWGA